MENIDTPQQGDIYTNKIFFNFGFQCEIYLHKLLRLVYFGTDYNHLYCIHSAHINNFTA